MTTPVKPASKVNLLPKEVRSLARDLPIAMPGTLFVLGANGGLSVAPDAGFDVMFGRNELDVHVCVGAGDPHVSRRHGRITREHSCWMLDNVGRLPIRFPDSRLLLGGDRAALPTAYTPLFIVAPEHEHLLQVRVTVACRDREVGDGYEMETSHRRVWPLSPTEHLVLVCLGQRYLGQETQPQPMTWNQVAWELAQLRPSEHWSARRAAHIVTNVRKRLSASVPGLREQEVPPPVGNTLNHNLIMELLVTTTIVKSDLSVLSGWTPPTQSR